MTDNDQIQEMARTICGLNTDKGCFCDGGYCNYNCLAYEKAKALYSKGYRKLVGNGQMKCPRCKTLSSELTQKWIGICPNCGADMRGE